MKGWKTKTGTILLGLGTAILGASNVAPSEELAGWCTFIGTVLSGVGGAFTAWGLGHKLEKAKGE